MHLKGKFDSSRLGLDQLRAFEIKLCAP